MDTIVTYSAKPEAGLYKIRSSATNNILTLAGCEGANVYVWSDDKEAHTDDQQGQISYLGKWQYSIISNSRGLLLSSTKGINEGAGRSQPVTGQSGLPKNHNGRWTFEAIVFENSLCYLIRSFAHKDQVIDVMGEENESALYIYNQLSFISTHQLWTLESI